MRDGKRSGLKGSGPQRGLTAELTGADLSGTSALTFTDKRAPDSARNRRKHPIGSYSHCVVSNPPGISPFLLALSFSRSLSRCLPLLHCLLVPFPPLCIFTLVCRLPYFCWPEENIKSPHRHPRCPIRITGRERTFCSQKLNSHETI